MQKRRQTEMFQHTFRQSMKFRSGDANLNSKAVQFPHQVHNAGVQLSLVKPVLSIIFPMQDNGTLKHVIGNAKDGAIPVAQGRADKRTLLHPFRKRQPQAFKGIAHGIHDPRRGI